MGPLPRAFYARGAADVARDLLGATLVHETRSGRLSGRIVETEAYGGADDPGSHAFRGRTDRNSVMFGPPGHAYVYRSYGIHACLNAVTDAAEVAGAVLIRALEPITGISLMQRNRGGRLPGELCNGPGKLCQALEISLELNGADLTGGPLRVESGTPPETVAVTGRVGLSRGGDMPLRFLVGDSPYVSRGRAQLTQ